MQLKWISVAGAGLAAALLGGVAIKQSADRPAVNAVELVSAATLAPAVEKRIDYARLDARIRRLMDEPGMVGLAVGVVEDGQVTFLKGYGERMRGGGEAVTTETVFRWASVSKGVAGTLAAQLADRGELVLDAPIAHYSRTLMLPRGAQIQATVRDVLSHRLGLWRNAFDDRLEDGQDPAEIRRALADTELTCLPGTCWSYQNVAFDAFSDVVERATGKTYAETVERDLFAPLGMTSASLDRDGLVGAANWARPHSVGGRVLEVQDAYYRVPTAGGVNSDIADMTTWLRAQMGAYPDVLLPQVTDNAQRPLVATPVENRRMRNYGERLGEARYGMGWRTYDYGGRTVVGHRGGVEGYRAFILFDPETRTGIVAMWNSNSGQPHGLQFEAMDLYYGNEFRDWLRLDAE